MNSNPLPALTAAPAAGSAWLRLRRSAVYMVLLCSAIAILITVMDRGGLVGKLIYSFAIGGSCYFEAADKYVRVVTASHEHLIRTSLRELLPQLDAQRFWQVHRGVVVRADAIATALRDESGKVTLTLRDHKDRLTASRLYAHRFRPM